MSPRRLLLLLLLALVSSLLAAAPAAASAAAGPVYALDPLSHKLKIKPGRLSFSDSRFTELRWRRWGTDVARARGIHRMLTCRPSCAEGGAETTATTLKLSRIREKNGRLRYTCMSWQDDQKVTELPDHNSLNPFTFRPCKPPAARPGCPSAASTRLHDRAGDGPAHGLPARALRDPRVDAASDATHARPARAALHQRQRRAADVRCTKDDMVAKATWASPARRAAPVSATARRAISAFASQRKKPCTAPS